MNWLWTFLAGTVSGVLGAMGMGGGGILIIYLTLFANVSQSTAQGINLLFFIPTAVLALFIYCKKGLISWKLAIPAAITGAIGAIIGVYLSAGIDNKLLSKGFGILLFIMGIVQFFSNHQKKSA